LDIVGLLTNTTFSQAFVLLQPILILPAAARARGEEIEREVREDMAEGLRELREQRLTI
jgi:hypothetical protein